MRAISPERQALKDPFSGANYINNQIPASQISPISQQILQHIPFRRAATQPSPRPPTTSTKISGCCVATIRSRATTVSQSAGIARTAKTPAYLDKNNYLANNVGRTWLNQSISVTDTHTFTPTLVNQFLFSFNRTDGNNVPIYPDKTFKDLGINIAVDDKPQWYVAVTGYWGTLNTGDTNRFLRDENQLSDVLRWTKGKHQISMGGEYGHGADDVTNNFRANGRFTFNGGSAPFTGDSFADFLVGKFQTIQQGAGEYRNTRFNRFASFFDDSWKMSPRFTLISVFAGSLSCPTPISMAAWQRGTRDSSRLVT